MNEESQLLKSAIVEIKSLRSRNQLLTARVDMFDECMLLLRTNLNYQNQGMSEDLVWKMEKFIDSKSTPK